MQILRAPQLNMISLAQRIEPLPSELLAAKMHRMSVKARLERAFKLTSMRDIGSHCRGTAVRQYSDVDLMVVLRKEEVQWGSKVVSSDTIIQRVLAELRGRFASSAIRKDSVAATIAFGSTKQSLDVVPAVFARFDKNASRPVFLIPDGSGGWFETSPPVHDRHFSTAQRASGSKLRKVSQLVKWWKFSRANGIPLRSFYADMVLATHDICVGVKPYGECLYDFFELLARSKCGALVDPCGIAGRIDAANTEVQRQQLHASVQHALQHAKAAIALQRERDFPGANRQWDIVFNGCF